MKRVCVLKAVLFDGVDPNTLPIEALHAACVHMVTRFVIHPSPGVAESVSALLEALAVHADAYQAPNGQDLYGSAAATWAQLSAVLQQEAAAGEVRH
ncbi:MAG: hypothetical protein WD928_05290 [Gammaproteobacteria bacterium]